MTSRGSLRQPPVPSRISSHDRSFRQDGQGHLGNVAGAGTSSNARWQGPQCKIIETGTPLATGLGTRRKPSVAFQAADHQTTARGDRKDQHNMADGGSTIKASKQVRHQSSTTATTAPRPFSPLALANAAGDGLRSFFASPSKVKPKASSTHVQAAHPPVSASRRTSQGFWQTLRRGDATGGDTADRQRSNGTGLPNKSRKRMSLQPVESVQRVPKASDDRDATDTIGRLGLIPRSQTPLEAIFQPPAVPFPVTEVAPSEPIGKPPSRLRTIKQSLTLFRSPKSTKAASEVALSAESAKPVRNVSNPVPSRHRLPDDGVASRGGMQSRQTSNPIPTTLIKTRDEPSRKGSRNTTHLQRQSDSDSPISGTRDSRMAQDIAQGVRSSPQSTPASPSFEQEDHFQLRVAVVYLVKTVLPQVLHRPAISRFQIILESTGSSEEAEALRSVLEERLRTLQRMERSWGTTWLTSENTSVRFRLSERTRQREAQALRDALRDGVVFCHLVNRLQGSRPPLVPKISLLDLHASRHANIKAFVLALRGLAVSQDDLMRLGDMSDASPTATKRIVNTILALAKLAGPQALEAAVSPSTAIKHDDGIRRPRPEGRRSGSELGKTRDRTARSAHQDHDKGAEPEGRPFARPRPIGFQGQLGERDRDRNQAVFSPPGTVNFAPGRRPAGNGPDDAAIAGQGTNTEYKRTSTPSLILSSSAARSSWTLSEPAEVRDVRVSLQHVEDDAIVVASPDIAQSTISDQQDIQHVKLDRVHAAKSTGSTHSPSRPSTIKVTPPRQLPVRSVSSSGKPGSSSEPSTPSRTKRESVVVTTHGHTAVYQLGNVIGRGQFGTVWRCLDISTGQIVAIKRISIEGLPEYEITQLLQEVELLHQLKHPGIVRYEGMSRDSLFLNIVLEYIEGGSLGATIKAFGSLNETLASSYAAKIIEALSYLHASDVVHLDLKAANILTTKRGNLKLSDFGVSLSLRAVEKTREADVAGSPNWMAPEVIELKGATKAADIWSLGCTIIELITGYPPYSEIRNDMAVMFRIVENGAPPFPYGISDALRRFLQACFRRDPLERPSADDLFRFEWIQHGLQFEQVVSATDSIPFLRRISMDGARSDSLADIRRYMEQANIGSPRPTSFALSDGGGPSLQTSPMSPTMPIPEEGSKHAYVRTRFGTTLECRLCAQPLKRNAMICSDCGLICHSTCAYTMVSTCTPQAGWTRSRAGSPEGTGAVRFLDGPSPTRVRPTLSRISLSTPTVLTVRREPSPDDDLPNETDSARSNRLREETLAKLSGLPSDRLTELPTKRRGASIRRTALPADLGSSEPAIYDPQNARPTSQNSSRFPVEDEGPAECVLL